MGLIVDTSVLIDAERSGTTVQRLLADLRTSFRQTETSISTVSVVELTHGIYRAKSIAAKERRSRFVGDAVRSFEVEPVTLEIAQLAGQIAGEQAAVGNLIAFEDLVIGSTALHLGFEVVTLNVRHFARIPRLIVRTL